MEENPLKVVSSENTPQHKHAYSGRKSHKQEAQARFERLWKHHPEQFDPEHDYMGKERLARSWKLIVGQIDLKGKRVVDLGCAAGAFSRMLRDAGAQVDAVDIASNALKMFKEKGDEGIHTTQDYVPRTLLDDDSYDLVVALDLIPYLHKEDHRLFFSELSRLVKPEGHVLCSTPLDFRTDDPLQRFGELAETEFVFEKWTLCYHKWLIRLTDFFEAPQIFVKASKDNEYRHQKLLHRVGFSHLWFRMNSTPILAFIWRIISFITSPITSWIKNSPFVLNQLEKFTRFR